jgi:hypothetical protein
VFRAKDPLPSCKRTPMKRFGGCVVAPSVPG